MIARANYPIESTLVNSWVIVEFGTFLQVGTISNSPEATIGTGTCSSKASSPVEAMRHYYLKEKNPVASTEDIFLER